MHTVIADECTGCDLCVEPCPVDCIDMVPVQTDLKTWKWDLPATNQKPVFHVIASEINLIASDLGRGAAFDANKATDETGKAA
jgi:electron transport complex protein RnfB